MADRHRRRSRRRPGFAGRVRDFIARLRHYHEISQVGPIARRYFALNAFDGVLTAVGVITGSFVGGVKNPDTVITVVLSTAIGIAVSGFYGSYLIEKAERGRALKELEESTLASLDDTDISAAARYATILIAIIDGASPALAAIMVLIPFFIVGPDSINVAYYIGWAIAFAELFGLGLFLGAVSRERFIVSGIKFTVAGAISLGLSLLLHVGA